MVDGRTGGRTPEHGYTISSPIEPNGSGELKHKIAKTNTNKTTATKINNEFIFFVFRKLGTSKSRRVTL